MVVEAHDQLLDVGPELGLAFGRPLERDPVLRHVEELTRVLLTVERQLDCDAHQAQVGTQVAVRPIEDVATRAAIELGVVERRWLTMSGALTSQLVTRGGLAVGALGQFGCFRHGAISVIRLK